MKIICRFLVNEHGDLFFFSCILLVHYNYPFYVKKIKRNLLEQIKRYSWRRTCKKSLVNHVNYDLENKDLRNLLSHCRLKEYNCPINYIWKCTILSILSLDVFRFHFNKPCFQLLQTLMWTARDKYDKYAVLLTSKYGQKKVPYAKMRFFFYTHARLYDLPTRRPILWDRPPRWQ